MTSDIRRIEIKVQKYWGDDAVWNEQLGQWISPEDDRLLRSAVRIEVKPDV